MKKLLLSALAILAMGIGNSSAHNTTKIDKERIELKSTPGTKIQVAILLDTSSSMDGLIEQTKARLWNIVNTLTTLRYHGHVPQIEISLYEYGNSNLSSSSGYIRQVTGLTTDLDLLSEYLFALRTYGGYEYCGTVINKAVTELDWGTDDADMKLIYIAGNEPFTQGLISYKTAINNALNHNIYVSTIHCGNEREGINGMWRDGAIRGRGRFFNIDHNARIRHVDTPYDARIAECNKRLNGTYVAYGDAGGARQINQRQQDENAQSFSSAYMADRAVAKSKSAYNNKNWDLVDLVAENEDALTEIDTKDMPTEYRNKSKAEIKADIDKKEKERAVIRNEITELAAKRQAYVDEELKKQGATGDDLGKAITASVLEIGAANGYSVVE